MKWYHHLGIMLAGAAGVWLGTMAIHAHADELTPPPNAWVVKDTAEALDHSRPDMFMGVYSEDGANPKLFASKEDCEAAMKEDEFVKRTVLMRIVMARWHPAAKLHQECVPLESLKEGPGQKI